MHSHGFIPPFMAAAVAAHGQAQAPTGIHRLRRTIHLESHTSSPAWAELRTLCEKNDLYIDRIPGFFEEMLVNFAGLSETPSKVSYLWKDTSLTLTLDLDPDTATDSADKFITHYQQLHASFNATEKAVEEEDSQGADVGQSSTSNQINNQNEECAEHKKIVKRAFELNVTDEMINTFLIDRFQNYFDTHPNFSALYLSRTQITVHEADKKRREYFNQFQLHLSHCDVFEEALCLMVERYVNSVFYVERAYAAENIVEDTLNITLEYLGMFAKRNHRNKKKRPREEELQEQKTTEDAASASANSTNASMEVLATDPIASLPQANLLAQEDGALIRKIRPTVSRTYPDNNDKYATLCAMNISMEDAKFIENYLNTIIGPNLAKIVNIESKSKIEGSMGNFLTGNHVSNCELVTISIKNIVFYHSAYLSMLQEVMQQMPRIQMESYRSLHTFHDKRWPSTVMVIQGLQDINVKLSHDENFGKYELLFDELKTKILDVVNFLQATLDHYLERQEIAVITRLKRHAMSAYFQLKSQLVLDEKLDDVSKNYESSLEQAFKDCKLLLDWYVHNHKNVPFLPVLTPPANEAQSASSLITQTATGSAMETEETVTKTAPTMRM